MTEEQQKFLQIANTLNSIIIYELESNPRFEFRKSFIKEYNDFVKAMPKNYPWLIKTYFRYINFNKAIIENYNKTESISLFWSFNELYHNIYKSKSTDSEIVRQQNMLDHIGFPKLYNQLKALKTKAEEACDISAVIDYMFKNSRYKSIIDKYILFKIHGYEVSADNLIYFSQFDKFMKGKIRSISQKTAISERINEVINEDLKNNKEENNNSGNYYNIDEEKYTE